MRRLEIGGLSNPSDHKPLRFVNLLILIIIIIAYIYFIQTEQAHTIIESIRDLGSFGILLGILIQTITNILPVPGEFVTIILLEIYGPLMGGVYCWLSGVIGALLALYITRWIARPFVESNLKPIVTNIDDYMQERGSIGLLMVRFIPFLPYHLVNYAAGVLNVKPMDFIWTTGLGILPFTIAISSIYAGVRNGMLVWGGVGLGLFSVMYGINLYLKKQKQLHLNIQRTEDYG